MGVTDVNDKFSLTYGGHFHGIRFLTHGIGVFIPEWEHFNVTYEI